MPIANIKIYAKKIFLNNIFTSENTIFSTCFSVIPVVDRSLKSLALALRLPLKLL